MTALSSVGCRQDMHDQPRYEPLEASDFFQDGRASRPFVPGTVPRGEEFLQIQTELYRGRKGDELVSTMPISVTPETLERGRERYNIFCSPCHDRVGNGNGMIVQRGYRAPRSFHVDELRRKPVGYYFDVITNGFGAMPKYSAQIPVKDRWAIVAYLRALQLSQFAMRSDVPPTELERLGAVSR